MCMIVGISLVLSVANRHSSHCSMFHRTLISYKAPCLVSSVCTMQLFHNEREIFLSTMCLFTLNAIVGCVYILHDQRRQLRNLIILASLGNEATFSSPTEQGKWLAINKNVGERTKVLQQCLYQSRSTPTSPTPADSRANSRLTLHSIIRIWTQMCPKKTSTWYRRRCSQEGTSTGNCRDQQ